MKFYMISCTSLNMIFKPVKYIYINLKNGCDHLLSFQQIESYQRFSVNVVLKDIAFKAEK